MDFFNHREGGMVFYQVILLSPLQCTVETVRGCVSLKKKNSQYKAVKVNLNSKEEKTLRTFVWILSKKSASVHYREEPLPNGVIHKRTHGGFIKGILRGVRCTKSLRVLFLHRRSPSWTTLVLYSRAVFIFNEPAYRLPRLTKIIPVFLQHL
jgi:hypothetical protein